MIYTYEPDGTVTPNPTGAPTAWLPDGTPYRVVFRFIQASEGLIGYSGIPNLCATYNAVKARWATYADMATDPALSTNIDVDVACVVTGSAIKSGRSGLFTEIEAATLDLSIFDEVGMFDPRLTNTVLGPGRRVRTGTWVQLTVFYSGAWHPMFTGLVDSWQRDINAEQPSTRDPRVPVSDVRVTCTDAFGSLGAASFDGSVSSQLTSDRVLALLSGVWQANWGTTAITVGTVTLDARTLDDAGVLGEIKAAAAVEDGRVFIAADGTFTFQTSAWRNNRNSKMTVLGVGARDFLGTLAVCTYKRIAATFASYNDVRAAFLTYDDMRLCTGGGATIPQVCASRMTSADTADDVINDVLLEYSAPQAPSGFVASTGDAVVANAPTEYRARDANSIARYGLRTVQRSDMTPNNPVVLSALASTIVGRWSRGDATITEVTIDLDAEATGHTVMFGLWSGDLINVVDHTPPAAMVDATDEWLITTAEVAGIAWNMTPERLDLALVLDDVS